MPASIVHGVPRPVCHQGEHVTIPGQHQVNLLKAHSRQRSAGIYSICFRQKAGSSLLASVQSASGKKQAALCRYLFNLLQAKSRQQPACIYASCSKRAEGSTLLPWSEPLVMPRRMCLCKIEVPVQTSIFGHLFIGSDRLVRVQCISQCPSPQSTALPRAPSLGRPNTCQLEPDASKHVCACPCPYVYAGAQPLGRLLCSPCVPLLPH